MSAERADKSVYTGAETGVDRRLRADARRSVNTLLAAAKAVFGSSGVDAPVREIADRAGVGIGTVYRHFPRRPDLVAAVFRQEIDDCADALEALAGDHPPLAALKEGMKRFVDLALTKRGLAQALHSGDPAFEGLPARREERLRPAFHVLFRTALVAGAIREDIDADELLDAAASLCLAAPAKRPDQAQRMVALLIDGLGSGMRA